ncbi:MAG: class I adenylate-forming enzyme family protein [Acidimicrobiia bacterium]
MWSQRLAEAERLTDPGGPFAMEQVVVRGIEVRNYVRRAASLAEVFQEATERFAERPALVQDDHRLTFAEVGERAAGVAGGLQAAGIRAGDRVVILGANSPQWAEVFWGCLLAGVVSVPLNAWWGKEELAYALDHSRASLVFADPERLPAVAGSVPDDRLVGLDSLVGFRKEPGSPVDLGEDDAVSIFYTSGTTGRPKGAMVDHRGVVANLRNLVYLAVRSRILAEEPRPEEPASQGVSLLVVPLFHVTGCQATLVASYAFGNRVVLYPQRGFDARTAMHLIQDEGITQFSAVPTLMLRILDSELLGDYDLGSLRSVTYGGAPVPPELPQRTRQALPGVRSIGNGYGLTETNAVVVANWGMEYLRKPHAIGKPLPVVDVKLVGPDGREAPDGEPGELAVRGPVVMAGYWRDEPATAVAIREGWFYTGDLVVRDSEGDLVLVDRVKDVVIRGGENVFSVEVENVLAEHPAVVEAAVVGVPHATLGEEVKAVVVVRRPVQPEELRAWCGERLAYFKVPAHVEVRVEPLPRNAAGKVLKETL